MLHRNNIAVQIMVQHVEVRFMLHPIWYNMLQNMLHLFKEHGPTFVDFGGTNGDFATQKSAT